MHSHGYFQWEGIINKSSHVVLLTVCPVLYFVFLLLRRINDFAIVQRLQNSIQWQQSLDPEG